VEGSCSTIETPENPGPLTDPIMAMHHLSPPLSVPPLLFGKTVVGAIFADNAPYPPQYRGFFLADYATHWIKVVKFDENDQFVSLTDLVDAAEWPVDLAIHPLTGEVYYASIFANQIRRITWVDDFWVDASLQPPLAVLSYAFDTNGEQQVGVVEDGAGTHAALWTGLSDRWLNLMPAGATASWAWGISEEAQVGWAEIDGIRRAGRWAGSAESWADLHPEWAESSEARATAGEQQVGMVEAGGLPQAALWTGTAESVVLLHPAWATGDSSANATNWRRCCGDRSKSRGSRCT